jgi:hypothetical protein
VARDSPGQPCHVRRVLAFTDVVVARDKAQRQTRRSVQAPGGDQIVFLRRAIKRNVARVQHQVDTRLGNVACHLAEIGDEVRFATAQVRIGNVGNAESHVAASLRRDHDSRLHTGARRWRGAAAGVEAASPGRGSGFGGRRPGIGEVIGAAVRPGAIGGQGSVRADQPFYHSFWPNVVAAHQRLAPAG